MKFTWTHLSTHLLLALLLFVAIVLDEHGVLAGLSADVIQLFLETLLFAGDPFKIGSVRLDEFLAVLAQLALSRVERLALLPEFVNLRLKVLLLDADKVLLLHEPLFV